MPEFIPDAATKSAPAIEGDSAMGRFANVNRDLFSGVVRDFGDNVKTAARPIMTSLGLQKPATTADYVGMAAAQALPVAAAGRGAVMGARAIPAMAEAAPGVVSALGRVAASTGLSAVRNTNQSRAAAGNEYADRGVLWPTMMDAAAAMFGEGVGAGVRTGAKMLSGPATKLAGVFVDIAEKIGIGPKGGAKVFNITGTNAPATFEAAVDALGKAPDRSTYQALRDSILRTLKLEHGPDPTGVAAGLFENAVPPLKRFGMAGPKMMRAAEQVAPAAQSNALRSVADSAMTAQMPPSPLPAGATVGSMAWDYLKPGLRSVPFVGRYVPKDADAEHHEQ